MGKRAITHIEITAKDRKQLAGFYEKVFGWETQHIDEMDYSTFVTDTVGGGFNPEGEQAAVGDVRVYLASDDIEADLKNIEANGGSVVVPKTEIPGMGWFAWFTDPTGNTMALYEDMNKDHSH